MSPQPRTVCTRRATGTRVSPPRAAMRDVRRARGIALVLVLWAVTLLTVIASSFAYTSRTETLLARNQATAVRAQVLADAGIERALYELYKPLADPLRWKTDGTTYTWAFDGVNVRIMIRDESAKINLNRAPDALIQGLLRNAGLNDEEVARLADAIADWRDADDFRRANGAEARDYEDAGRNYTPANGAFETIDDLRLVLNMTPEVYKKISGSLTVHSARTGFNSLTAAPEVLYAIPEVNRDAVAQYIAQRERARKEGQPLVPFAPALPYSSVNNAVYNIVAEAETEDGSAFARETSVQVIPPAQVVRLSWREADRSPPPVPAENTSGERD